MSRIRRKFLKNRARFEIGKSYEKFNRKIVKEPLPTASQYDLICDHDGPVKATNNSLVCDKNKCFTIWFVVNFI